MKNMFLFIIALAISSMFTVTCSAGEGFYSESLFLSDDISVGGHTVKVYTRRQIDTSVLLQNLSEEDSSSAIQSKINSKRMKLYPNEEIAVEINHASGKSEISRQAPVYMSLKQELYWWNSYSAYGDRWWALYDCNVATLFVNVLQGSYKLRRYYNDSWSLIASNMYTSYAGWLTGNYRLQGFKGKGLSTDNVADIVMFFFE